MDVIPFNVPGLPDLETLASRFVLKPAMVDASDPQAGPLLALAPGAAAPQGSAGAEGEGVLCLYPGLEMVSYLFAANFRTGQNALVPALVVHNQAADGSCAVFAFSSEPGGDPVLIVNILPDEYLSTILLGGDGGPILDLSGVGDRLEITQSFAANSFGVVSRSANDVTNLPKEAGNAIFKLYDDPAYIADICSFYMTRMLTLAPSAGAAASATPAPGALAPSAAVSTVTGVGNPLFRLLWKPATFAGLATFSVAYVVQKTSISVRWKSGETSAALDYNLDANRRDGDRPN